MAVGDDERDVSSSNVDVLEHVVDESLSVNDSVLLQ